MTQRPHKVPGPEHPITIAANTNRVVVTLDSATIASSVEALTLCEANYPAVQYIPRKDVDMAALSRSNTTTHCPYKGEASYFGFSADDGRWVDVAWSYEEPYAAVAAIRGYPRLSRLLPWPGRRDPRGACRTVTVTAGTALHALRSRLSSDEDKWPI